MAARIPGTLNFQQPRGRCLRMVMTAEANLKKKIKCSDSMLIIIITLNFRRTKCIFQTVFCVCTKCLYSQD